MCRSLLQILDLQRETSFQVFYVNFTSVLEELFTEPCQRLPLVGLS